MKSSHDWYRRQQKDPYVKASREEGWRSRAAYKLMALAEKDRLFERCRVIIDLGAAPGSWSEVAKHYAPKATVIAVDRLPIQPIKGVDIIQGDLRSSATVDCLLSALAGHKANLVLSDMAPNLTGIRITDQSAMVELLDLVLAFAVDQLSPDGRLVCKFFHGAETERWLKQVRSHFKHVKIRKPLASRQSSAEVYLVAYGLKIGMKVESLLAR